MSFRHGPGSRLTGDPIDGVAQAEALAARKHLMNLLRAIDGDQELLTPERRTARHLILQAVPLVDSAHIFLGGEDDEQR